MDTVRLPSPLVRLLAALPFAALACCTGVSGVSMKSSLSAGFAPPTGERDRAGSEEDIPRESAGGAGASDELQDLLLSLERRGVHPSALAGTELGHALARFGAGAEELVEAELAEALAATGLSTTVRFLTAEPGAKIRYHLAGRQSHETAHGLSNDSLEVLPIGLYYVWCERDGVPTSPAERYKLIQETETLHLLETDRPSS